MSFASLFDVVGHGLVEPTARWFVKEIDELIAERGTHFDHMRQLGANGNTLAAHRDATDDLMIFRDRWVDAMTPEGSTA